MRSAGAVRLSIGAEAGLDGDAAEVDPAVAGVEWSLDDPSGSGQESVDGIVLTGADQPCVLHLVVGRPVTRCQIEVGRHVPGVGLGEGGHEVGVPIEVCEVVDAGIDTRWERVAAALGKVSTW